MKTEVYSWRVSPDLKSDLERAARRQKVSVSNILDQAAREWLKSTKAAADDGEEQRRLHCAAEKFIGAIEGSDPMRSEKVSQIVRQRLREKYGR